MAVTALVTTAGSASANAYVTSAVANQYHEDRPAADTSWSGASGDAKIAAILWATKLLDLHYEWNGFPINGTQSLNWPRSGLETQNGYTLDDDSIPNELQQATAEYARQLIAEDRAADSDIETQGIQEISVGSIALKFKDTVLAKNVPDAVVWLLPRSWGRVRGRHNIRKLMRA